MFGKLGKKVGQLFDRVSAVEGLLANLARDVGDVKAMVADGRRLWGDIQLALAEIKVMTGHTAAPAAPHVVVVPQSGLPLMTVPDQGSSGTPLRTTPVGGPAGLSGELAKDVVGVDPMRGVRLP